MKRTFMIGVAAGALIAGINLASAQGTMERQPAASGSGGGANIEQRGGASMEQKGRAIGADQKGGADIKANSPAGNARAQSQGDMKATTGQNPQDQRAQDTQKKDAPKGQNAQSTSEPSKSGAAAQGERSGAATTGQGAAGSAKASLSTEQKTKIRETVIRSSNAPRVTKVNFSLSVGTVVPRTVRFAPLPPVLVEVYPEWRTYQYFIVEEQIVIIEPGSLKIVAVIAV